MSAALSRRDALKGGAAALLLGFCLPARSRAESKNVELNAWVRITPDNRITVLTEVPEMGQGTRTAGVMMLADELEVEWTSIRWEQAPTNPQIYKHLTTGGSGGLAATWLPMRKAGAQARELLLTAAARQWAVDKKDCHAENGAIVYAPTNRRSPYGELIETAATLPVVNLEQVPLKDSKNFRFIGKPIGRVDTPDKVDGSAIFGLDVRVPGMLFAVIVRCPHFGGKLATFDGSDANAVPGVKAVFEVPPIGYVPAIERNLNVAGGVAVVADSTWAAMQGRKALNITWDKGPGAQESTATLQQQFREKAGGPPTVVSADHGNVAETLRNAARKIEANYEMPFQAHAPMEPMNTTVHVRSAQSDGVVVRDSVNDGRIEVWSPTQGADLAQRTIAHLAGVPPENVIVHMTFSGGSFGRRYQWDYLAESYQVAKEMKVPVQLMWTREDDMQHDFYLQYSYQRLEGAVDSEGNIIAWSQRILSTPIRAVFDSPELLRDPKHGAEGVDSIPYEARDYRFDYVPAVSVVPRAWWRSVSSPFQVFAVECFVDELAHAAGQDPYEFRLKHLRADQSSKFRAVLHLAAEKSNWGKPLAANHGRGIACCRFGDTYVAHVAEVSVNNGALRVHRVTSAVDCGLAVNPDSVRAQIEGGINYALTPVLSGEISVKEGAVEQSNFDKYQVLRMKDAPDIEVHLVPGGGDPHGGVGEGGVPPLAPAVANAIFAATGKRVRRLPILKVA